MLAKCVFIAVLVALVRSDSDDVLLAKAHNTLAVNLLKHLTSENPSDNVFFSPTSIATAFGMAYAGARGRSEAELASALGHTAFGLTERPRVLAAYKKLLELAASPNVTLEVANMVLAQNNFDVSDSYKQQLQEIFDAELRSVDFANEGPRVAAQVNAWVRGKTRGKITSILPEGQPLDIIMFILNAVYFKGTWVTKFDPARTADQPFFNDGTTEVNKPAMNLRKRFPYTRISSLNAGAVEIPYQGNDFSMVVLLPDSRTGVAQLRDGLSLPVLEDVANHLGFRDVILRLPKLDMSLRYNLVPAMRAMGLDGVFGNTANFTGISDSTLVRISDAVHKATVEVNEEGTVATAVTGISFTRLAAHYEPPPPVQFIVDHPFIFYIRDRNTNRVLFIGEVKHL
uniref:Serpin 2 n=1 Tax=Haemaphysalis flava TaxID=181088 RepID=A0A0S2CCT2_HAEFA|nr:serpin 2 [Haemaphysalis flava]